MSLDTMISPYRIANLHIVRQYDLQEPELNARLAFIQRCELDIARIDYLDVSDVSGKWDTIWEYEFNNEKHAAMFLLAFPPCMI